MKTTGRSLAIIRQLTEHEGPMTTSMIADRLGVSSKTILRELSHVERFLALYHLNLVRKTGAGIYIEGSPEDLKRLREQAGEAPTGEFSPQQRLTVIGGQLLRSTEPVKLFVLGNFLDVTDGTVSKDLDKIEPWFEQYDLKLIRRPGLGAYVEGRERDKRRAMIQLIYDNLGEGEVMSLVQDPQAATQKGDPAEQYLLAFMDQPLVRRMEQLLQEMPTDIFPELSDLSITGLAVHMAIAVQRIRQGAEIEMDPDLLKDLQKHREYRAAGMLADAIEKEFSLTVSEQETGCITMHLLGARSFYRNSLGERTSVQDEFHLVLLAKAILKRAEEKLGYSFGHTHKVVLGLVNHLGPTISRLKMQMTIRNPLLQEMREMYPQYMELARDAVELLEAELGHRLPEAEIAYIAMHLGAAVEEQDHARKQKAKVLDACPAGMGTSRLLASRIQSVYANIQIIGQVSALRFPEGTRADTAADFIISTVPIPDAPIPVVVTTPLLEEADQQRVDAMLNHLQQSGRHGKADPKRQTIPFQEALRQMAAYNQAIQSLLEHGFRQEVTGAVQIEDLCRIAAEAVTDTPERQHGIVEALREREAKGSTILRGNGMILMHARTGYADCLQFGILHLDVPLRYPAGESEAEPVRTVMVLLAPAQCSQEELETIGAISTSLLERLGFIEILHEGNPDRVHKELIQIFRSFYQKKYKELILDQPAG